jgi:general secretion pathway protein D
MTAGLGGVLRPLLLGLAAIAVARAQKPIFVPPAPPPLMPIPKASAPPAQAPKPKPASPSAATPANPGSKIVYGGLNLQNASLTEVIDMLARQLKINYVMDSRVKGGVILNTYGETKNINSKELLDSILRINNAAMVKEGDLYRVVPLTEINRAPLEVQRLESKDIPDDEQEMLNLVFLKYTTAEELSGVLKNFIGANAQIFSYAPANLLLLLDSRRSMHRTMELVALFDNDVLANQRVRTYETTNGRPSDIAKELEDIFKGIALNGKNSPIRFLPIDRLNTIVAVAPNPGAFGEVQKWIEKLDVPAKTTAGDVDNYVYRVKYGDAQCLAQAIMALYGGYPLYGCQTTSNLSRSGSGSSGFGGSAYGGGAYGGGGVGGGGYGTTGAYGGGAYGGGGYGAGAYGAGGYGGGGYGGGGYGGGGYGGGAYGAGNAGFGTGISPTGAPTAQGTVPGLALSQQADLTGQYLGNQGQMGRMRGPHVIGNPFANTLLIQATPQDYVGITKLLRDLDVPPRQVLIQAQVFEVDLTGAFSSGVSAYLQKLGAGTAATSTTTTSGTGTTGSSTSSTASTTTNGGAATANISRQLLGSFVNGSGVLTAGTLVGMSRELLAAVTFQVSKTRAKVISAPSIIATDSVSASINVGESVPTLTSTAATGVQSGGSSLFANTISQQDSGVTLSVIARVNTSGIVTMVINQEVSAPVPPASGGINSPSFNKRTVQTQVTVQDGDMVAIGGIMDETTSTSSSGIPYLHELPVIGGLFGSRSTSKQRTELVIFLTPHVIYDTNQIVDATEELKASFKTLKGAIKNQ